MDNTVVNVPSTISFDLNPSASAGQREPGNHLGMAPYI
jgi:hypothetical protein